MVDYVEWLRALIINHRSLEYVIIFLGTLFGAEFALFIFGFLAAQNVLSILPVAVLGFLGTLLPNILWFLIGHTMAGSQEVLNRTDKATSIVTAAINKISRNNHFVALAIIKFIIGTPFILTAYINKAGLKFWQFIYYETPAIILSLLIMLSIGFLSGLGFTYLYDFFNNLYLAIGFILLIAVVIVMVKLWIKKIVV